MPWQYRRDFPLCILMFNIQYVWHVKMIQTFVCHLRVSWVSDLITLQWQPSIKTNIKCSSGVKRWTLWVYSLMGTWVTECYRLAFSRLKQKDKCRGIVKEMFPLLLSFLRHRTGCTSKDMLTDQERDRLTAAKCILSPPHTQVASICVRKQNSGGSKILQQGR